MRTITISDKQAEMLLRHYSAERENLRKKIIDLNNDIQEMDKLISNLKQSSIESNQAVNLFPDSSRYQKNWTWIKKAIHVLEHNQRPMKAREIMKEIYMYEPELKKDDRKKFAALSGAISIKTEGKNPILERTQENGEWVYCLAESSNEYHQYKKDDNHMQLSS